MKLSLNEKTLIIIGIFVICLLFLNNLYKDNDKFDKSYTEEETEPNNKSSVNTFVNTSSLNTFSNNTNSSTPIGSPENNIQDNKETDVQDNKETEVEDNRETDYQKLDKLNQYNNRKINNILTASNEYIETVNKIYDKNENEKNKVQDNIVKGLIYGHQEDQDPSKNFESHLTYNGNILRNSLLKTASEF